MDWHPCLYHLSFPKKIRLTEKGCLTKGLLKCKGLLPLCIVCKFRTTCHHLWHWHNKASGSIRCPEHVLPGNSVLMDQIVSAQPGLIPQMSGFLTSSCIWGCTMFCNHVSDIFYVFLMRDFTINEAILAVKAFEKVMAQAKRTVKHYHADNGVFVHKRFLDEVNRKKQKITFWAIGTHHQNGIVENKNKRLALSARTLLLHGIHMWPQMINTMFYPFAFKAVAERHNCLSLNSNDLTPNSILHNIHLTQFRSKLFILCFSQFTSLTHGHKVLAALPPPNGSLGAVLEFILGTCPFMLVVWHWYSTHALGKFPCSITLFLTVLSPPFLIWCRNGSPSLGGPALTFNQEGHRQRFRVGPGLDGHNEKRCHVSQMKWLGVASLTHLQWSQTQPLQMLPGMQPHPTVAPQMSLRVMRAIEGGNIAHFGLISFAFGHCSWFDFEETEFYLYRWRKIQSSEWFRLTQGHRCSCQVATVDATACQSAWSRTQLFPAWKNMWRKMQPKKKPRSPGHPRKTKVVTLLTIFPLWMMSIYLPSQFFSRKQWVRKW